MKIMITGNMGYVGPALVARLRDTWPDATLIGADLGFFGHCLTGADELPERRLSAQYFLDVRKLPPELLRGVDAVVHLAAISNDPMGKAFEDVTAEINYEATVKVARQAREAGVRHFVMASSCSVYGYAEGEARNEQSEVNPLTAYARSKIDSEKALRELADADFTVTSLRFPTACGMSPRLRLDLVLNDFVAAAVASGRIAILSDGTPWRPLIDTKDMARAIEWAIQREQSARGAFLAINAGRSEWNYQVRDLARQVREALPDVEIDINKDAQPDKRSYRVDFSLYREQAPHHQPQVDLKQSIAELIAGLKRMRFDDADFRNSLYIRLKVLSGLRECGRLNERLEWIRAEAAGR